jgi:hypothetical protein
VTSTDRQVGDFNFPTSVTGSGGFFVDLPGRQSQAGMPDAIGMQPAAESHKLLHAERD